MVVNRLLSQTTRSTPRAARAKGVPRDKTMDSRTDGAAPVSKTPVLRSQVVGPAKVGEHNQRYSLRSRRPPSSITSATASKVQAIPQKPNIHEVIAPDMQTDPVFRERRSNPVSTSSQAVSRHPSSNGSTSTSSILNEKTKSDKSCSIGGALTAPAKSAASQLTSEATEAAPVPSNISEQKLNTTVSSKSAGETQTPTATKITTQSTAQTVLERPKILKRACVFRESTDFPERIKAPVKRSISPLSRFGIGYCH